MLKSLIDIAENSTKVLRAHLPLLFDVMLKVCRVESWVDVCGEGCDCDMSCLWIRWLDGCMGGWMDG